MSFDMRPGIWGLALLIILSGVFEQNGAPWFQREVVVDFTGLNALPPTSDPVKIDVAIPPSVWSRGTAHALPLELSVASVGVSGPENDRAFDVEIRIRNTGQASFFLPVSPLSLDGNRTALEPNNKGRRTAVITLLVEDVASRRRSQIDGVGLAGSRTLLNSMLELQPGDSTLIRFRARFSLNRSIENVDINASVNVTTFEDGPGTPMAAEVAESVSRNPLRKSIR
jgi:hypothetical protein